MVTVGWIRLSSVLLLKADTADLLFVNTAPGKTVTNRELETDFQSSSGCLESSSSNVSCRVIRKFIKALSTTISVAILPFAFAGCAITPQPFSANTLEANGIERLTSYLDTQDRIETPIGLYEAMVRAIKYNLDDEVERMEQALRVRELQLANLISDNSVRVRGYVAGEEVDRLAIGSNSRFVPDLLELDSLDGTLVNITDTYAERISIPALSSRFQGDIAVSGTSQELEPLGTWYGVLIELGDDAYIQRRVVRGVVHSPGEAESLAAVAWRQIMRVLIRESSV